MRKRGQNKRLVIQAAALFTFVLTPFPAVAADPPPIAYPHGYRQWTHIKTMQIKPGHPLHQAFGGVHHIYANKQALAGYRRGKFAKGATLVLDLLEAREDGFAMSEGARKLVAVMHKDPVKFKDTGGWGFEAFRGDNRKERLVGKDAAAACFRCHAGQQKSDYVFSIYKP